MKDLARDLGVSVVTISKVLRNHSDISIETRERVLKRMKELNYRPNLTARALVTGRTHAMGLVVPDLVHPFFSVVANGLSSVLRERGYGLIISSSQEDPSLEQREIDQLVSRRVDALVIASAQKDSDAFRWIENVGTPYVLIDRRFDRISANFVGVDDERVGELATTHLIQQGCRRIAHLRGPEVSTGLGRLAGYQRALARHGIAPLPGYVVAARSGDDQSHVSGGEAMKKLLELRPRPDGLFCYNDPTALGAMKVLLDAGVRIPEDIAVIGCGNVLYSELLRVPLSSVDQRSATIGEQAGILALSLVESKTPPQPKSILLEPRLVPRASSLKSTP
jgi:LacI family transcriptional regulator